MKKVETADNFNHSVGPNSPAYPFFHLPGIWSFQWSVNERRGCRYHKIISSKQISRIWAFWLANNKNNFTISQSKCSNLGNQFCRNQLRDDSALNCIWKWWMDEFPVYSKVKNWDEPTVNPWSSIMGSRWIHPRCTNVSYNNMVKGVVILVPCTLRFLTLVPHLK